MDTTTQSGTDQAVGGMEEGLLPPSLCSKYFVYDNWELRATPHSEACRENRSHSVDSAAAVWSVAIFTPTLLTCIRTRPAIRQSALTRTNQQGRFNRPTVRFRRTVSAYSSQHQSKYLITIHILIHILLHPLSRNLKRSVSAALAAKPIFFFKEHNNYGWMADAAEAGDAYRRSSPRQRSTPTQFEARFAP